MVAVNSEPQHPLAQARFQEVVLLSPVPVIGVVVMISDAAKIAAAQDDVTLFGWAEFPGGYMVGGFSSMEIAGDIDHVHSFFKIGTLRCA